MKKSLPVTTWPDLSGASQGTKPKPPACVKPINSPLATNGQGCCVQECSATAPFTVESLSQLVFTIRKAQNHNTVPVVCVRVIDNCVMDRSTIMMIFLIAELEPDTEEVRCQVDLNIAENRKDGKEKGSNVAKICLKTSPGVVVTAQDASPKHKLQVRGSQSHITPPHATYPPSSSTLLLYVSVAEYGFHPVANTALVYQRGWVQYLPSSSILLLYVGVGGYSILTANNPDHRAVSQQCR
ncbi:hypothetical protein J6590_042493 [Homalodisca vitripennis]|nr:hypothetical protein J6590_042493 [Homalodisca vitripennis]